MSKFTHRGKSAIVCRPSTVANILGRGLEGGRVKCPRHFLCVADRLAESGIKTDRLAYARDIPTTRTTYAAVLMMARNRQPFWAALLACLVLAHTATTAAALETARAEQLVPAGTLRRGPEAMGHRHCLL